MIKPNKDTQIESVNTVYPKLELDAISKPLTTKQKIINSSPKLKQNTTDEKGEANVSVNPKLELKAITKPLSSKPKTEDPKSDGCLDAVTKPLPSEPNTKDAKGEPNVSVNPKLESKAITKPLSSKPKKEDPKSDVGLDAVTKPLPSEPNTKDAKGEPNVYVNPNLELNAITKSLSSKPKNDELFVIPKIELDAVKESLSNQAPGKNQRMQFADDSALQKPLAANNQQKPTAISGNTQHEVTALAANNQQKPTALSINNPHEPTALAANNQQKPTALSVNNQQKPASKLFNNPFNNFKVPKLGSLFGKFGNKLASANKPHAGINKPSAIGNNPTGINKPSATSINKPLATEIDKPLGFNNPPILANGLDKKEERYASPPRILPASYPPRNRDIDEDKQRGYPRVPAIGEGLPNNYGMAGDSFGLNQPTPAALLYDRSKSALFADPLDPKKLEQIFKELQRFAANLASVSTSMITNLKEQSNNFRTLVIKTDERRKNDLYLNFLSTLDRILDRYMQIHKVFLIDNNFSRKLQYAWRYAPEVSQQQIDAMMKNVIDPFFVNISGLTANAMPKQMVGGAANDPQNETSSPNVFYSYEKYIEKLEQQREKLYDFYYNKASNSMFQWTSTHTLIYSMKLLRVLFLWMALYLTSKTFQARYVQKVFADNEDPPRLETMVLMFWALEAVLMVFVFIILYLIKYLLNSDSNFIINDGVIGKFMGDYIASTVLIVLAGLVIGRIMMKKKYFRYKSDGLRAIRSFEEVMWYISIFILAFPFFVIF